VRALRCLAALIAVVAGTLPTPLASGDGGTVRLVESVGPFVVTIFTAPEPVRVGSVDVSVLVQDRARGEPLLDARVSLDAIPPDGGGTTPLHVEATRSRATNKLLYAAAFTPDRTGEWRLRVAVRRGPDAAEVHCDLPVARAAAGIADIWPYLALPPAVVALYALRARLVRRRRSRRLAGVARARRA